MKRGDIARGDIVRVDELKRPSPRYRGELIVTEIVDDREDCARVVGSGAERIDAHFPPDELILVASASYLTPQQRREREDRILAAIDPALAEMIDAYNALPDRIEAFAHGPDSASLMYQLGRVTKNLPALLDFCDLQNELVARQIRMVARQIRIINDYERNSPSVVVELVRRGSQ